MVLRSIKMLTVIVVSLFALALTGLQATPAYAAGPCSTDSICFFNSSGDLYPMIDHDDADTSAGECFDMGSNYINKTSYIRNNADHQYYVYTSNGCTGTRGLIYASSYGRMESPFDNSINSFKRIG